MKVISALAALPLLFSAAFAGDAPVVDTATAEVLRDQPVAFWSFEDESQDQQEGYVKSLATDWKGTSGLDEANMALVPTGQPRRVDGPRPSEFPDFLPGNQAVAFPKGKNYYLLKDVSGRGPLDFDNGDSITLECWVRWIEPLSGTYPYLIGKGRSVPGDRNQNYALRLANNTSGVFPTLLFGDAETKPSKASGDEGWHRWTASKSVPEDGSWHHIALSYTFGEPKSIVAYVDGVSSKGKWDMGGETTKAPVVDDDHLWVGSSMGGNSTFNREIDNVAIYRAVLSPERIKAHAKINLDASPYVIGKVEPQDAPLDRIRVEIMPGSVPVSRSWTFRPRAMEPLYETDSFALNQLPRAYNDKGLIIDRPVPFLIRLATQVELEPMFDADGKEPTREYEFIVRSLDSARLYIDGELLTETPFMSLRGSAHGAYYDLPEQTDDILSIPAAHSEKRVTVTLDEGPHIISLCRLVGNKGKSPYLGELSLAYGPVGGPYKFVSPTRDTSYTDAGWLSLIQEDRPRRRDWEQNERNSKDASEREYWNRRHAHAASIIKNRTGSNEPLTPIEIDRHILNKLNNAGEKPQPLTDDYSFLRRLALDTTGTIPTPEQIEQYLAAPRETRRKLAIERFTSAPGWADHWVGYWQDVLAENPGLTKPELNNTGPFRWYLYEAMLDNRPIDRFVTELVMMEGSKLDGGPAGFGMASQNDVPMAAKAHVLGTAFLGVEMKCARCHDAPYPDLKQEDLFAMAAMLDRNPLKVPGSSSIPVSPERLAEMTVKVTLKPGASVKPNWPFMDIVGDHPLDHADTQSKESATTTQVSLIEPLPADLYRTGKDSRSQLAAQITSPHNRRFARVMVNRVWQRLLGRGLVEPVDDWEDPNCSHPELLDRLADEFVSHGYDLKHITRLILSSDVYQRVATNEHRDSDEAALFTGPTRRRLNGEQLADSLMVATGKDYAAESLTMDGDGSQAFATFVHLRRPTRAWQFVAVSNERDRPSLNLPVAQSVVDLLASFGWRQQRQDPLTRREDSLTALQPLALAHGTTANRFLDLSDDSALTELALIDQPLSNAIDQVFLRLMSRLPKTEERELYTQLLSPGYEDRIIAGPEATRSPRIFRSGISWSNHFDPKSDVEAITRQNEILSGDPPTKRLSSDWRERLEDTAWTLVNSPEFTFVP